MYIFNINIHSLCLLYLEYISKYFKIIKDLKRKFRFKIMFNMKIHMIL